MSIVESNIYVCMHDHTGKIINSYIHFSQNELGTSQTNKMLRQIERKSFIIATFNLNLKAFNSHLHTIGKRIKEHSNHISLYSSCD